MKHVCRRPIGTGAGLVGGSGAGVGAVLRSRTAGRIVGGCIGVASGRLTGRDTTIRRAGGAAVLLCTTVTSSLPDGMCGTVVVVAVRATLGSGAVVTLG